LLDLEFLSFSLALKGVPNLAILQPFGNSRTGKSPITFYNQVIS
jgi:hypothetical protein